MQQFPSLDTNTVQVRSSQLHEHNRICSTIHMSEIGTSNFRIDTRINRVIQLSMTYRKERKHARPEDLAILMTLEKLAARAESLPIDGILHFFLCCKKTYNS